MCVGNLLERVYYVISKRHELWSTNGLKLDRHFNHPTQILHFASSTGFVDEDQQTELNQTLPNGG